MPTPKPSLGASGLPRVDERRTFGYFERARLHVDGSSLVIITHDGKSCVPPTMFSCVFLGSGCSVTTEAAYLLSDSGTPVAWVRDGMVKMMSSARPLSSKTDAAAHQARMWYDPGLHMDVVRRMYRLRFGEGYSDGCETLGTLQGREASRVKKSYVELAEKFGVKWAVRRNKEMDEDDPINYALSVARGLYHGLASSAVFGLGYLPQLGFIHSESPLAFALDIADIFKTRFADEAVFRMIGELPDLRGDQERLNRETRKRIRFQVVEDKIMRQLVDATVHVLNDTKHPQFMSDTKRAQWWDGT